MEVSFQDGPHCVIMLRLLKLDRCFWSIMRFLTQFVEFQSLNMLRKHCFMMRLSIIEFSRFLKSRFITNDVWKPFTKIDAADLLVDGQKSKVDPIRFKVSSTYFGQRYKIVYEANCENNTEWSNYLIHVSHNFRLPH